jgi:hypothetical protein
MSCSIEIHVLYFNPELSVDGYCKFWVKASWVTGKK